MKTYRVTTHLGVYETTAKSAARAISNIRFRLFGSSPYGKRYTLNWTATEA